MKNLVISRIGLDNNIASYKTRGLDTITEREAQMQEDCLEAIKHVMAEVDSKAQMQDIAKKLMSIAAAVHSDLERILRNHGKDAADASA